MAKRMEKFDCAVIGAGASGMMAAIAAARSGARVLLVEHENRVGKKLVATGNGKCNFTNAYMEDSCYRGDAALLGLLERFTKEDTISFFHEIGIFPKEKKGYYYPNSEQASAVAAALEMELKRFSVTLLLSAEVISITESSASFSNHAKHLCTHSGSGFRLETGSGKFFASTVIFATGLLASPKLGSDGSAFDLIKGFGHHFTRIVPALCGFYAEGMDWKKAAGVRCDAKIGILVDGEIVSEDSGELQLTDYGISGIPVFQVSRYASMALAKKQSAEASIRFLPEMNRDDILKEFLFRMEHLGGSSTRQTDEPRVPVGIAAHQLLDGLVNQKLIPVLLKKAGLSMESVVSDLSQAEPLVSCMMDYRITLLKPRDYEFAQVCAGGLDSRDIDVHTLMSRLVPGIFFCGELLDVDGICGGYNLQWAWSSGYAAGMNAAAYVSQRADSKNISDV
jgi:hypothetical protein